MLQEKSVILFQGDSITDQNQREPITNGMGTGYPLFVSGMLAAAYPELDLEFINKGISGNKVKDLRNRLDEDIIKLQPDFISILIGINDSWHYACNGNHVDNADFEADYRYILEEITNKTNAEIMIIEPFILPREDKYEIIRNDLDGKIDIIRKLAREFKTLYIPLDGLLNSMCTQNDYKVWSEDGIHPTNAGHAFIAQKWLETMGV